jgi:hypothetical protein
VLIDLAHYRQHCPLGLRGRVVSRLVMNDRAVNSLPTAANTGMRWTTTGFMLHHVGRTTMKAALNPQTPTMHCRMIGPHGSSRTADGHSSVSRIPLRRR